MGAFGHRRRVAVLATVCTLLLAAACGSPSDEDVGADDTSSITAASEPSPTAQTGRWTAMAEPPATVGTGAPTVWTGAHVIVWGGGFPIDGAKPFGGGS